MFAEEFRGSYTWQREKVYNLAVRGEKSVRIEESSLAQCQGWLSKCLKLITVWKGSQEMRGRKKTRVNAKSTWPRREKKYSGSNPQTIQLDIYRVHLNGNIAYILICGSFWSLQRQEQAKVWMMPVSRLDSCPCTIDTEAGVRQVSPHWDTCTYIAQSPAVTQPHLSSPANLYCFPSGRFYSSTQNHHNLLTLVLGV